MIHKCRTISSVQTGCNYLRDQDISSRNTVNSEVFLQKKKIIPKGAEVHMIFRLKLNFSSTWKIGHILPTGNRIYSGPKLAYNPKSLPRERTFLFIHNHLVWNSVQSKAILWHQPWQCVTVCNNSGRTDMHNTTHRRQKEHSDLKAQAIAWFFTAWTSIISTDVHCVLALPGGGNTLQFPLLQKCGGGLIILFIRLVKAIKRKNSQFDKLYSSRTPYCQQTWMRGTSLIILHEEKRKNQQPDCIFKLDN